MADKVPAQAWYEYLASFGYSAYDENTVPEDASFPRITYSWAESGFESPVSISASLWDYSMRWDIISQIADRIYADIGDGGKIIPFTGGYIWAKRGAPFSQRVTDPNDAIRRILINFAIEFFRK